MAYAITLRIGRTKHQISGLAVSERMEIVKVWRINGWPAGPKLPRPGRRVDVLNTQNQATLTILVSRSWRAKGQVLIEGRRVLE